MFSGICNSIVVTGATSGIIMINIMQRTDLPDIPLPLHQQSLFCRTLHVPAPSTSCCRTGTRTFTTSLYASGKPSSSKGLPLALCNLKSRTKSSARVVSYPLNCLRSRDHAGSELRVHMPCCDSLFRGKAVYSLLPLSRY